MTELLCRRDLEFQLFELLRVDALCAHPRFSPHDRASISDVLAQAARLARERFEPFAAQLDRTPPEVVDGRVVTVPALAEAIEAYVNAGFCAMSFAPEHGGTGLPFVAAMAASLHFSAANAPAQGYAFLTMAAANLLLHCGDEAQVRAYALPLIEGRWFGTMALSEPQAGSSLADVSTRAEPAGDGGYHLTGSKMWISCAEHELRENIVNLVLARLPDAPPGVKGISLFIAPKYLPDAQGRPGARNGIKLVGLNHKMGHGGTTNTALALGDDGQPCVGYLVGAPHRGLAYMFHMMNEARVGVGATAAVTAYAGFRHALAYAKERVQGRALASKSATSAPVAIVEHPDVRRMLLAQKCIAEGSLLLCLYCAKLIDERALAEDDATRDERTLLLEVLTPIAKSWPSERGVEANSLAIQVLGGYGYTRDFPVERLFREQRLNPIHEGTTGMQALDLLGRKARLEGGRGLQLLAQRIADTAARARGHGDAALASYADALDAAVARLAGVTVTLLQCAASDPTLGLGNATVYLELAGQVVLAWLWLEQGLLATERGAAARGDDARFYEGKRAACRYFFLYELPKIEPMAALLERLDPLLLLDPAVL